MNKRVREREKPWTRPCLNLSISSSRFVCWHLFLRGVRVCIVPTSREHMVGPLRGGVPIRVLFFLILLILVLGRDLLLDLLSLLSVPLSLMHVFFIHFSSCGIYSCLDPKRLSSPHFPIR